MTLHDLPSRPAPFVDLTDLPDGPSAAYGIAAEEPLPQPWAEDPAWAVICGWALHIRAARTPGGPTPAARAAEVLARLLGACSRDPLARQPFYTDGTCPSCRTPRSAWLTMNAWGCRHCGQRASLADLAQRVTGGLLTWTGDPEAPPAPPIPANEAQAIGSPPPNGHTDSFLAAIKSELARKESVGPIPDRWQPRPVTAISADESRLDWVWEGFLARGLVTDFYGLWKSGKSTLVAALLATLGRGGVLAGRAVAPGQVLVISEEPASKWGRRRDEVGLGDHVHTIARPFARKPRWDEWERFMAYLQTLAGQYALIVFDALPNLWPVIDENSAGEVQRAVLPLQALAEAGAAVLLVRHPRKTDGGEGTAGRGSGALSALADIIVEFRRFDPERPEDTRRVLTVYSREEPFEVVVRWDGGTTYTVLGDRAAARQQDRLQVVLDLLAQGALTAEALLARWPEGEVPRPGRRTLEQDLAQLVAAGQVVRQGSGTRGNPFAYALAERGRADSFLASSLSIAARKESGSPRCGNCTGPLELDDAGRCLWCGADPSAPHQGRGGQPRVPANAGGCGDRAGPGPQVLLAKEK